MIRQTPVESDHYSLCSDEDVTGSPLDLIFLRAVGIHLASSSADSQHSHNPA
jgi:hypothetical protein